jgi:hypothetical protein
MVISRPAKPTALLCAVLLLSAAVQFAGATAAWAGSAGLLPFSSSNGVPNGAADNIASLVSTEVDIRGGYELVLSASSDEVQEGCGERSSCITSYGGKNNFQHVITGSVSTAGRTRYTLVLTLYQVSSGKALRQVLNTLDRSPDALLDGIPDLVVELLTGRRPVREEAPAGGGGEKPALFSDDDDFGEEMGPRDSATGSAGNGAAASDNGRKWMERDRHGRLTRPVDEGDDPLGLDEIDDMDLDLDELSPDHQEKKRKVRKEREDLARARYLEEERLAEVAAEEQRQREERRARREEERRREEDRIEREEQRRIAQERELRREEEIRREREDQRLDEERERRRAEQRRLDEQEREQRADKERRRDARERERREAEDLRREEDERRLARARFQEEEEAEERRRRDSRDRYDQQEDEDDITLDAGIIIIETDDEYEEGGGLSELSEDDAEFGILIEEDDGDGDGYQERSYDEPSYDEPSYDERSYDERSDRERVDEGRGSRRSRSYKDPKPELNLDRRFDDTPRARPSAGGGYGSGTRAERGSRSSSSRASARSPQRASRPRGAVRVSAGYNFYYLSFLRLGLEGNIYVLPQLSLDLGIQAWMLWLRTGEDLRLAARVLPNFLIGASYRMTFHPIVRPFVGGEVGTVIYAQKVEVSNNEVLRKTPLFALTLAAKGGSEFELGRKFALFVALRVGVSISGDLEQDGLADIQQYVNETWEPTRVFFNVGVGARYAF